MDIRLSQNQPWRLSPRGQRWFDRVLVGILFLPAPLFPLDGGAWSWALLGTAQSIPLLWRRSHSVAVFMAIALACLVQAFVVDTPIWTQVSVPIAIYSVARYSTALWSGVAVAIGILGAFIASYVWILAYTDKEEVSGSAYASYVLTIATIVVASWALGTLARVRKAYVDTLVERGKQIERDTQQQIALAASAERARIAREMHDVVAHGLTTMVVQADGARYAAAQKPEVAAQTLANISETGREALTEMRRLLGLLRSEETGTAPQPRLPDIATLVADVQVKAELSGLERPVPDGLALTAYRVVQEALSNVRKHAGPAAATRVRVTVDDDIEILVEDDGRGASALDDGQGLGLLGMRERVLAHEGRLETGPRPSGGYRVWARLPLRTAQ